MTSLVKSDVRQGVRQALPNQRAAAGNAAPAAEPASAASAPAAATADPPAPLSARDAACLGFALTAALLIFSGLAGAVVEDGVPPGPQVGITAR